MNQPFNAQAQGEVDYVVEVIPVNLAGTSDGVRMCICVQEAAIYITREQAMKFFNLSPN